MDNKGQSLVSTAIGILVAVNGSSYGSYQLNCHRCRSNSSYPGCSGYN